MLGNNNAFSRSPKLTLDEREHYITWNMQKLFSASSKCNYLAIGLATDKCNHKAVMILKYDASVAVNRSILIKFSIQSCLSCDTQ